MKRREIITLLGAAAAAWPLAARAQQDSRVRRIGVLAGGTEDDSATRANLAAMREGLAKLGWIEGRNLRIDLRFTGSDPDRMRAYARELVNLAPDVIVTSSFPTTRRRKSTLRLFRLSSRRGLTPPPTICSKTLRDPKAIRPGSPARSIRSAANGWSCLRRPLLMSREWRSCPQTVNVGYFGPIETAASRLSVQALKTPVSDPLEIVRAIDAFAADPNGGLLAVPVLPVDSYQMLHRVAAQHRLPAVHSTRGAVAAGGLMSYATDFPETYRRAAAYVDRLLRGAKVSELPVQFPTKFQLVVNLKTAKAIELTIPEAFLLRADEVIE
jgi:putative tryptophan/tyrosine transport system substrate-binding protein